MDHKGPQIMMERVYILYSILLIHYSSVISILRRRYSVILLVQATHSFCQGSVFLLALSGFNPFSFFILGCCFFLVSLFLQAIELETISVYFFADVNSLSLMLVKHDRKLSL